MATKIEISGPPTAEIPAAVEQEIAAFNEWFSSSPSVGGLGNDPLLPLEVALLRTYLLARLSGRVSPPAGT